MNNDSPGDIPVLGPDWSGIRFAGFGRFVSWELRQFSFHAVQFTVNFLVLGRVSPHLVIVLLGMRTWSSTDNLQHPFGGICFLWTRISSVLFKVVDQSRTVFSQITKVDGSSTLLQEKQTVKLLQQDSRWLMNSTQNGLSAISKLSHQLTDRPGSLGIKTRGRFIQEQQQFRLCNQLDTDGQTFTLLHIQTFTSNTN